MAKAIQAGVGVGKYARVEKEYQCIQCGQAFMATRSDARYCHQCKPLKPSRPRGTTSLVCKDCSGTFEGYRADAIRCPTCRLADGRAQRFETRHKTPCPVCGQPKFRRSAKCRACFAKERGLIQRGSNNPSWKGGRSQKDGYTLVANPDRLRRKARYVAEHILVWEAVNGPSPRNGHIHHLNGEKQDNRLENLQWLSMSEHHSSKGYAPYETRIRSLEARIRELEAPS